MKVRQIISRLLVHPLAGTSDLDSPETTELRKQIIGNKPFLGRVYEDWYRALAAEVPAGSGAVLEVGSGAGFLDCFVPGVITSDPLWVRGVQSVLRAEALPFADGSLRAVVMQNVLHHVSAPRCFFAEAQRVLRPGGRVLMLEPWVSRWSRLVYGRLHHEPFVPEALAWEFDSTGPLSGANMALPWIMFNRDRQVFQREFSCLGIRKITPCCPFRYLLSGGVSMRSLVPSCSFTFWGGVESMLGRHMDRWAMFALIVLEKEQL